MDALARSGLFFNRAYCAEATCSRSRTALLTGRRPDTTCVYDLVTHFRDTLSDIVTLPQQFKLNGYFTQSLGKIYHGGLDDELSWSAPSLFQRGGGGVPAGAQGEFPAPVEKTAAKQGAGADEDEGGAGDKPSWAALEVEDDALVDGKVAGAAIRVMRERKDEPFFLAVRTRATATVLSRRTPTRARALTANRTRDSLPRRSLPERKLTLKFTSYSLAASGVLLMVIAASCAWSQQNPNQNNQKRPNAGQKPKAGGANGKRKGAAPANGANAANLGARQNYPTGETLDVRDFGAKGDGVTDDTAAIRRAMEAILDRKRAKLGTPIWTAGHHTLYLPDGTYLVSGPLTFGDKAEVTEGRRAATGLLQREIHVVGQSRAGTVIRLKDGSFTDAANPQTVFSFFDGDGGNNLFANTFEDITVDAGRNAGAIALNHHDNNFGYVRRVTLKGDGYCGLNLGTNLSGIGLVSDVEVQGFDYGIINGGQFKIAYVLENITLSGQKKAGIWNKDKELSVRALTSDNSVPALLQRSEYNEDNGLVVLVDSTLRGGDPNAPAVDNRNGWLVARDLNVSGYGATLRDHGKTVNLKAGEEHVTGGALSLWDDAAKTTLDLPVEEAPVIPDDAPDQIAVVDGSEEDDTKALQAAIDSGKTTVRLKRGKYTLTDTIVLRGAVRRLNADWSLVDISSFEKEDKPVFRVADGSAPAVMIEKMDTRPGGGTREGKARFVEQATSRTLILRDIYFEGAAAYRNTVPGKLFVEGVFSTSTAMPAKMTNLPGWEFTNQKVWARHINHEGNYPHFLNDGGQVWILGFKGGEGHGPYFRTINGGQTEILGGIFNNLVSQAIYPAGTADVEIVDSDVSISGLETSNAGKGTQGPSPVTVRETREGQTRELKPDAAPRRQNKQLDARALPLFVSKGRR